MFVIDILIGMPVTHHAGDPAQAVVMPGADIWVLPFRIRGFLVHGLSEYVAVPLQLPAVPVGVQGQAAFPVIPEHLGVSHLVNPLTDFAQAVVTVLYGTAVAIRGTADLPRRGVPIAFLYAVRKADAGDAPPAVHLIGHRVAVAVRNPCYLPPGIVLILLDGAPAVPRRLAAASCAAALLSPAPVFQFPSPRRRMALTFPSSP